MEDEIPEEDLRPIICWNCSKKFLLDPKEKKGRCPFCKEINEIVLTFPDLSDELKDVLTVVQCHLCKRKILIRRESEYVVCANCKSTILVEKDVINETPPEYSNLTPREFYLLMAKENSFNPYLFPVNSSYYLEPDFEKKLHELKNKDSQQNTTKKQRKIGHDDGYEHLFDQVNKNQMAITNKFMNK